MQFDHGFRLKLDENSLQTDAVRSLTFTPLSDRLSLSIKAPSSESPYPTSKIQKGPVLECGSTDLSGEGIGFGVPVAKLGRRVFFPGRAHVTERRKDPNLCEWIADYELNLEERIALKDGESIRSDTVYSLVERFAEVHKAISISRGPIECASSVLRRMWGLRTTFETVPSYGNVRVSYCIGSSDKVLHITVDASRLKPECEEMVLLNEHDGTFFDRYNDADGLELAGKAIGSWEKTAAAWATLSDSQHNVTLYFRRTTGSSMYRGREVVPGRLSWAGVAYVSTPPCTHFEYDIAIQEAT